MVGLEQVGNAWGNCPHLRKGFQTTDPEEPSPTFRTIIRARPSATED